MAAPSQLSPNQDSATKDLAKKSNAELDTATPSNSNAAPTENTQTASEEAPITLKDPPSPPVTLKDPPFPLKEEELTYANTQSSNTFLLAKTFLQDGDFDTCLDTIGQEMARITSLLGEEIASVHESMAPLYYLYGTTLLYSVEESTDIAAMNGGMNDDDGADEGEEPEDSQIAWENLEAARHIVQHMVQCTDTPSRELQLDLAQIHERLGDLEKSNGRYVEAISDYQTALGIRQHVLGMYDRKVATLHHALGMVYMSLASQGDMHESDSTPEQVNKYRVQSVEAYVACAKSLTGQIALSCGASAEQVMSDSLEHVGAGKTTGMKQDELTIYNASNIVKNIRQHVSSLATPNGGNDDNIHEYKELLDEIQETIDEIETSKRGIQQVHDMKVKAKEAVANSDGGAVENVDGSTTTIGFGNAASVAATTGDTVAAAQPMMVVKKKKKRGPETSETDGTTPAQGDDKRAKTE